MHDKFYGYYTTNFIFSGPLQIGYNGTVNTGRKLTFLHIIVIAQVSGIYGSKRTEPEGVARRQGLFVLS